MHEPTFHQEVIYFLKISAVVSQNYFIPIRVTRLPRHLSNQISNYLIPTEQFRMI